MTASSPAATSSESPFTLRDGRSVSVGPVGPAARPLIEQGIARLSPESSRRRFFTVRYRLSDKELDELTILDGYHRFAVGASVEGPGGVTEGVGVARFVRDQREPSAAEVALLVVDAYQGQGVGKMLLTRRAEAALARGITRFRGMVLADNDAMLGLLAKLTPDVALARADGHLNFEARLPRRVPRRPSWLERGITRIARYLNLAITGRFSASAARPGS